MSKTDEFKSALIQLEKLQEFKKPFTKFFDETVYSNTYSESDNNEFYLLHSSSAEFENLEDEIEQTALKLARLLELKENGLRETVIKYAKQL